MPPKQDAGNPKQMDNQIILSPFFLYSFIGAYIPPRFYVLK